VNSLIRAILRIIFAVFIVVILAYSSFEIGARYFLADVVGAHGRALFGLPFTVQTPEIDYRKKLVTWSGWKIINPGDRNAASPIVSIASVTMQLPLEFKPDWHSAGFIPSPMHIKKVILEGVTLSYDIDSEAEALNLLKSRISATAETAMRDRLNAAAKDENSYQSFFIDEIILTGVVIDAVSRHSPSKSQQIDMKQIAVSGLGIEEQGLHGVEIVDRVSRLLMDGVKQKASLHGLVDVKPVIAPTKNTTRRKSDVVTSEKNDGEVKGEEGGAKKAVKAVGRGFKKAGQSIGQGFKKLFN